MHVSVFGPINSTVLVSYIQLNKCGSPSLPSSTPCPHARSHPPFLLPYLPPLPSLSPPPSPQAARPSSMHAAWLVVATRDKATEGQGLTT